MDVTDHNPLVSSHPPPHFSLFLHLLFLCSTSYHFTWMCPPVTSFRAIQLLSLDFHHSCSAPTVCFYFFVNFVCPQPLVCLKLNYLLAIIFQACGGKQPSILLKHLNTFCCRCFFFHRLNTNCAFMQRVGYRFRSLLSFPHSRRI